MDTGNYKVSAAVLGLLQEGADRHWPVLERVLVGASLAASGWFAASFAIAANARLGVPYEIEWLEGLEFLHALRMQAGESWYPPPSLEFLPSVYAPGYKVVSASLMGLFGNSLSVMRGLSVCCTVISVFAMVAIVRRATGRTTPGLVAGGLFLASYPICGSWFDVARVDMLGLALVLVGILLTDREGSGFSFGSGIALLSLACLVKQTNVAFLLAVLAICVLWDWRRAFPATVAAATFVGGSVLLLQWVSNGWYFYYTVTLPGALPKDWTKVTHAITTELASLSGWTVLLILGSLVWVVRRRRWDVLPVLLLPVALFASLYTRSGVGSFANNLIPASAFLALATGIGLDAVTRAGPWLRSRTTIAYVLVLVQFTVLRFDVTAELPHPRDLVRARATIEYVSTLPGPILAPYHPYLLSSAGHEPHLHFHLVNEILSVAGEEEEKLRASIVESIRGRKWKTLISTQVAGGTEFLWGSAGHSGTEEWSYRPVTRLFPEDDFSTLFPLTGNPVRPFLVYEPVP